MTLGIFKPFSVTLSGFFWSDGHVMFHLRNRFCSSPTLSQSAWMCEVNTFFCEDKKKKPVFWEGRVEGSCCVLGHVRWPRWRELWFKYSWIMSDFFKHSAEWMALLCLLDVTPPHIVPVCLPLPVLSAWDLTHTFVYFSFVVCLSPTSPTSTSCVSSPIVLVLLTRCHVSLLGCCCCFFFVFLWITDQKQNRVSAWWTRSRGPSRPVYAESP